MSLTIAVPEDILFSPRSLGEGSQNELQLKGCWWFSLEPKKAHQGVTAIGKSLEIARQSPAGLVL
jgi:hypothetical protein